MNPDKLILNSTNFPKNPNKAPGEYKVGQYQEHVEDLSVYSDLLKIENWRNMFSSLKLSVFTLDDRDWLSREHFYQASKFKDESNSENNDFYEQFSLNSDSALSKDPYKARLAGETGMMGEEKLPPNVRVRPDFFGDIDKKVIKVALFAQFSQNKDLQEALLSTHDAELYHIVNDENGNPSLQLWKELMTVRMVIKSFGNKDKLSKRSEFSSYIINKTLISDKDLRNQANQLSNNEDLRLLMSDMPGVLSNIVGGYVGNPFVIVVKIDEKNKKRTITIPSIETNSRVVIDWGDGIGEIVEKDTVNLEHLYSEPGEYIISFNGDITDIDFFGVSSLINISQWGNVKIRKGKFSSCLHLGFITATDSPNLSEVTDLERMFSGCDLFNGDLSKWDVSRVTNMESMFSNCSSFNGDLSKWDVSRVTNMETMFYNCSSFNQDLSNWDVSRVTNMEAMFQGCDLFNGYLSNWDVSSVTNMEAMFKECKLFNGDLSNWDVSSVTNMKGMFKECKLFNGDLSNWDVSSVTKMKGMFNGCKLFNGDLSNWDVSNVRNMIGMFNRCKLFNGDLSNWDVSNVRYMASMFEKCSLFNGDLSEWDVSNVRIMRNMFRDCSSFDSDISKWNVRNVHTMTAMFRNCKNFNADLSRWDVSRVRDMNMDTIFYGCDSLQKEHRFVSLKNSESESESESD